MTKIISNGFSVTPVYDGEDGAPGKDGESALAADITNEMDSVAMDSGGAVLAQTVLTTTFNMWFGTSHQSLSALTASGAATGVTVSCNASTGVVTITIAAGTTLTGDKNVIALTGVCSKGERTVQFTVAGVRGGENGNPAVVYSLVTSASEIVKKKDGSYNPTGNITCAVTKNVGGNQSTPAASEYTLKMKVNGGAEQNYAPVASNTVTSSIEFILYVNSVVVDRETVPLLEDGTNGVSTNSVTEYYLATSAGSGVTRDTAGWTTTIQTITSTNKYLWNYEVITYSDGSTSATDPVIIGTYGRDGTNGTSISSITEYYLATSAGSGVTRDTAGWTTSVQTISATNKYLWNYEVVTYSNGSTSSTDPVIIGTYGRDGIDGIDGIDGDDGISISSVTEYYLATSAGSGVTRNTPGWSTSIQTITSTNKYLWNYEVITYSNGSTTSTDPVIIGTYGRDGIDGDDGISISSVTEYYLATSAGSGVTRNTPGWTTSVQTITTTNKYLWNYEVITYSNGSTTSTDPVIIGAYGETGQPGSPGSPGERGKTGPMFYLAGEWASGTSYTRNDDLCPVVYYSSEYWYLKNNGTYRGYTPSDSSSVWGKAQNFNMVFTDVLFAKTFALLGSFVVNQDWFISQYGVNKPNSSTSQENSNAYTNFRASDPQAQGPTYPCFSPYLKIDAKSGAIYAMKGSIGGFTIDSKILTNSDWEAGLEISYDSKSVKIGKNAKGDMGTENAIIRAENTKSGGTYNTALYLNAANGTYNYAFYGQGNGVLNGYVQGYKVKVLNSIGGSNYLSLNDGMVQAIASVGTNSDKYVYLPTLGECRKTLGIPVDNTKDFCCTMLIINQSAITTTTYNRDNVYVRGDTHDYATAITSTSARPVVLAQGNPKKLDLENCSMVHIVITYINKRFIANYIKTTW